MSVDKINFKIGFIGAGNMARAICEGIVRKGLCNYDNIQVSAVSDTTLDTWKKLGARTTKDNLEIMKENDVIFLAVKPHILKTVIHDIAKKNSFFTDRKLFISILAGITLDTLEELIYKIYANAVIVRTMPNTPMMVGEGYTVYCARENFFNIPEYVKALETILKSSGKCRQVTESLINACSAVAGSGPAFVYLVIEAMSDGGVKMGLPRQLATELAAQTVLGAAKMVQETGKHPGQLKDEVCSPGGSTITGMHELEKGAVRSAFINAIETTAKKAKEMGETNK